MSIIKSNESILIRLKQESKDIIIKKKKFDNETIIRNIGSEISKYNYNQKNLEDKYEKLDSYIKKINQEIEDLKSLNNKLKKENEEIKTDISKLKEENKSLKEANKDLELIIRKYKNINDENDNIINGEKKQSETNIKDIIEEEKNNNPNKLNKLEKLENKPKNNLRQIIPKLNFDNINNSIDNDILNENEEGIRPSNLVKKKSNKNKRLKKKFLLTNPELLNDLSLKDPDIINEENEQDEEPNETERFSKKNKFTESTRENSFTNKKNIDKEVNSFNLNNKIPHLNRNYNNNLKMISSYKEIPLNRVVIKKNSRKNNDNSSSKNTESSLYKTYSHSKMKTRNNNECNFIGNNGNIIKDNNIKRIKSKENFDNNKIRNDSIDIKRNEINENKSKDINKNIAGTPNNCYMKKIYFNNSNDKSNHYKIIKNYKNIPKYRINDGIKQINLNEILYNTHNEINKVFKLNENKKEENKIKNNKNKNFNTIDFKNNYNLEQKYNLNNCANIIKEFKGSKIINATLQCLTSIKQLVKYFLSNKEEIKAKYIQHQFSNSFLEMIVNLWENKSIKIYNSKNNINILLNQEENSLFNPNELIKFILTNLHQELNKAQDINIYFKNEFDDDFENYFHNYEKYYNKNFQSIISELFYFIYGSNNYCAKCDNKFLNIQFDNIIEFHLEEVTKFHNNKNLIYINDCFKFYNGIKLKKCNKCNLSKSMHNINILLRGPKILIISINRKKIYENNFVIEEEINLNDCFYYEEIKYKYTLISFMSYSEKGKDNFIVFCKSFVDDNWYKYFDSIVSKTILEEQKTKVFLIY